MIKNKSESWKWLFQDYNEKRGDEQADYTVGIFQSIGFKEFHDYLILDTESQQSEAGKALFEKGKAQMMLHTRQYARKQTKWIRQRFLRGDDRECPSVYGFDSSDPSKWESGVLRPATAVVEAYLAQDFDRLEQKPLAATISAHGFEESRKMFRCQICCLDVKGKLQFDFHVKSRRHKSLASRTEMSPKAAKKETLRIEKGQRGGGPALTASMKILREATALPLHQIKDALTKEDATLDFVPKWTSDNEADAKQDIVERLRAHSVIVSFEK